MEISASDAEEVRELARLGFSIRCIAFLLFPTVEPVKEVLENIAQVAIRPKRSEYGFARLSKEHRELLDNI